MQPPPQPSDVIQSLVDPLLDRIRIGRPALGLAYYAGEKLDPRWVVALDSYIQARGFYADHLRLSDLGASPAQRLLSRQRVADHLFTLEITPADLPDAATTLHTAVAQLNIQRDTLRDQHLGLILWIPASHARRFADLASNLSDYRTVDVDLTGFSAESPPRVDVGTHRAIHNLPFDSIGSQFIGREAALAALRQMLLQSGASAITDALAVEGLGGIGKTRLALEYAYTHLADYAFIFFLRADDPSTLRREIASLADLSLPGLSLPPEAQEDARMDAARAWLLQHPGWLLIFDNADAESSATYLSEEILPPLRGHGHILLTTRYARWGGQVQALKLDSLALDTGSHFLLTATTITRRAQTSDAEDARLLVELVDGLPLALEQISAWISHHHSSLREAYDNLRQEDAALLSWYDPAAMRYPLSVAALWEQTLRSLSAPEHFLIRLLAWLAPQPVADFLFATASQFDELAGQDVPQLIRRLESRSILKARDDRATQLHRLHHELERRRTPPTERAPACLRAMQMLARVLPPSPDDVRTWPRMRLLTPHLQAVLDDAASHPLAATADQSFLLNQYAIYLQAQARYSQAEPLMRRALEIDQASHGPQHPKVAIRLNNLAQLLQATNRMAEAEPLMRRALEIDQASYGPQHPRVAVQLNNLATLLQATNRLAEAEPLMRRALEIDEASYGPQHPNVARDLNNLAQLLQATNRLAEAEPLMRRALEIDEASYGPQHPRVAGHLNNLASLLKATNRLAEAELLMRRALEIDEASYGPQHPRVATGLNNLARLLQATNRLVEAEPLMRRHVLIFLHFTVATGHPHPHLRPALNNYATLLQAWQGDEAVGPAIRSLGPEAGMEQERFQELLAEPLGKRRPAL